MQFGYDGHERGNLISVLFFCLFGLSGSHMHMNASRPFSVCTCVSLLKMRWCLKKLCHLEKSSEHRETPPGPSPTTNSLLEKEQRTSSSLKKKKYMPELPPLFGICLVKDKYTWTWKDEKQRQTSRHFLLASGLWVYGLSSCFVNKHRTATALLLLHQREYFSMCV